MKIAIAGYGTEGQVSYEYYRDRGDDEVVIVDEREDVVLPAGVKSVLGSGAFRQLDEFDLIIRSPGIPPSRLPYGDKVWSATNEFFEKCQVPIIGVTGTKGKGTTASLIASILRAGDKKVHLVGNIGVPALSVLDAIKPDDIVVYELSSFQLWDLKKSPHVAVVLGIEPDHLDVHADFAEYIAAKAHITENEVTTDRVVFDVSNEASTAIAGLSVGQRLPYPSERTAHVEGNYFYYYDKELCSLDELQLPGKHNVENACAAITAVWPWVQEPLAIAEGLRSFDGLPHRLKFVGEVGNIKYFDDSIATTPGSAIAALRAFDEPKVIILGGSDKGVSYEEIIQVCKETDAKVIATGKTGEKVSELCLSIGVDCLSVSGDMNAVVREAARVAMPGSVVILSPASASFDQYKDYVDRGEQFVVAVNALEGAK